jgi:hypothetical protein
MFIDFKAASILFQAIMNDAKDKDIRHEIALSLICDASLVVADQLSELS